MIKYIIQIFVLTILLSCSSADSWYFSEIQNDMSTINLLNKEIKYRGDTTQTQLHLPPEFFNRTDLVYISYSNPKLKNIQDRHSSCNLITSDSVYNYYKNMLMRGKYSGQTKDISVQYLGKSFIGTVYNYTNTDKRSAFDKFILFNISDKERLDDEISVSIMHAIYVLPREGVVLDQSLYKPYTW